MKHKKRIHIFFTVDDNYVPFLSVTLASLVAHSSTDYTYDITIIHDGGLSLRSMAKLLAFRKKNIIITFFNVTFKAQAVAGSLDVRDYYTVTTYYRLFLPDLFPLKNKALYLDSDIVILDDVAKLYNVELGDNLVGAIVDSSVQEYSEFSTYVEKVLRMDHTKYFNAGILLMNMKKLREFGLERRAFELLEKVTFKVAQDQDILNFLCRDKVTYIPVEWNVMPLGKVIENPSLIHYNLMFKPWNLKGIRYEEHFWKYAEEVGIAPAIKKNLDALPKEVTEKFWQGVQGVKDFCLLEAGRADTYYAVLFEETPKKKRGRKRKPTMEEHIDVSIERLEALRATASENRRKILERIVELERQGKFDVDAENDPPYRPLVVGEVDYLRKKFFSRVKTMWANYYSNQFFNKLIKKGQIIIDDYVGVEHLKNLRSGAIITANHFNPFDSIPIHKAVAKHARRRKLFKVIREGNYTMPGLFGYFLRNCNTLPLAANPIILRDFMNSMDIILKRGDLVLVYPEQSLWWNYRKPKPCKPGAFRFAVRSGVPVIPTFITMRDTDKLDGDGLPIQAYTLHILDPIYPDPELSEAENIERMKKANEEAWKKCYEEVYGVPLKYLTEETKK